MLGEHQMKQIVFEAETLQAVVVLALWRPQIKFKRSVLYVDNEETNLSLIKGLLTMKRVTNYLRSLLRLTPRHTRIFDFTCCVLQQCGG